MTREAHALLLSAVTVSSGQVYWSAPMRLEFLKKGLIHLVSSANSATGGTITIYGSNLLPKNDAGGRALSTTAGQPAVPGLDSTVGTGGSATGWATTGISLTIPNAIPLNTFLPAQPTDGPSVELLHEWIRIQVAPTGGNITLDAWAKFKAEAA
jgi:hypothetical protein